MPHKLRNSMKGLINIKNNDDACFLWCLIRHLNPLKTSSERITKAYKNMVNDLHYEGIKLPASKKVIVRLNKKLIFALMYFVIKIIWFILFMYQIKNLKII